jgi:hypothetical protein
MLQLLRSPIPTAAWRGTYKEVTLAVELPGRLDVLI